MDFEVMINNEMLVEATETIMVQCLVTNGVAQFANPMAVINIENDDSKD